MKKHSLKYSESILASINQETLGVIQTVLGNGALVTYQKGFMCSITVSKKWCHLTCPLTLKMVTLLYYYSFTITQ